MRPCSPSAATLPALLALIVQLVMSFLLYVLQDRFALPSAVFQSPIALLVRLVIIVVLLVWERFRLNFVVPAIIAQAILAFLTRRNLSVRRVSSVQPVHLHPLHV